MMKRTKGATLAEILAVTECQAHTVRGFVSILDSKGGEKIELSQNVRQRTDLQDREISSGHGKGIGCWGCCFLGYADIALRALNFSILRSCVETGTARSSRSRTNMSTWIPSQVPSTIPTVPREDSSQRTTDPSESSVSRSCPVSPVTTVMGSVSR